MSGIKLALLGLVVVAMAVISTAGGTSTRAATPSFGAALDFGIGCLLGGAQNGTFIKAQDAAAKINGGETYKIYSLKGRLGTATGSRPTSFGVPCEEEFDITTRPSYAQKEVIGLGGNWPGMPRVPVAIGPNSPVYKTAVSDLLKARGLSNPNVLIDQIYRIDLEGDGVTEVLVSASYFKSGYPPQPAGGPSPDADAGDYSIVFMRKVVAGKVQTVVLAENIYMQDAEFIAPSQFRIRGVVDLNGDGKMEVLVYGRYYEGAWTSVFDINGTQFQEVLSCGCGV
jgi:hypothetical protein